MPLLENRKREALSIVQRKGVSRLLSPSSQTITGSMAEQSINSANTIISKWDPNSSSHTLLFHHHHRHEAKEFLQSIKNLRQVMHSHTSTNDHLVQTQKLMQIAMKRLEKEFYQILSTNRNHLVPAPDFEDQNAALDSTTKPEPESSTSMSDLKLIADCMIGCGYRRECVTVYKLTRKSVVDEGLYRLGIERYRSSHLNKMNKEALDRVITNWLSAIKTAVTTIFNEERLLCDHVFASSESTREACFLEIIKESSTNLFRFPQLISKAKHSQHTIFKSIELYEAISDLWPDIHSIFRSDSTSAIKSEALASILKLGDSVRSTLSDFETSIQRDSSKAPVAGGGIHPLTLSVMSYISSLAEHDVVLSDIVADHPPTGTLQFPELEPYLESPSALSVHLSRLILVLLCKLDGKTGLYRDVSLSYLFLANNLQFIVDRVHTTKLRYILGDEWVFSHAKKVVQYASSYQIMAWTKVFSSLPAESVTAEEARECFIKFNAAFEEAYRKQISWVIPDGKLRDEVKVSIARSLVPAYQEFYDTYLVTLSGEGRLEEVVRYAPDDLENYLSDLFHGTSISGTSSDSSTHLPGSLPR